MPAFEYTAIDSKGRQKKGIQEGDNARQARQRLKERGLTPVSCIETQGSQTHKSTALEPRSQLFQLKRRVSTKELAMITRQLATLIQAGLPLEECLKAVVEQTERAYLRSVMANIRSRVVEGYTLAESFAAHHQIFDRLFCAMVAAGEKSGHLDNVLARLADYAEARQHMGMKLQQAMLYPLMLTVVAIGVIAFLLATVVPKLVDQFVQTGQDLPMSTQILIVASNFIQHWGLWLLLAFGLLGLLCKRLLKDGARRLAWDQFKVGLPVIGKTVKGLNTARFARTLSICTSSSIPLLEGMKVAADVMENQMMKKAVLGAAETVREGTSLRKALSDTKLFPPMMLHMIASGEQSGELESMLTRAADNQDREFEASLALALGIFQPVLILTMAGMVVFIVLATLMPILALNDMVMG